MTKRKAKATGQKVAEVPILYASLEQLTRRFGAPRKDGCFIIRLRQVRNTTAGLRYNHFRRRMEPNPISVQFDAELEPYGKVVDPKATVPWNCYSQFPEATSTIREMMVRRNIPSARLY